MFQCCLTLASPVMLGVRWLKKRCTHVPFFGSFVATSKVTSVLLVKLNWIAEMNKCDGVHYTMNVCRLINLTDSIDKWFMHPSCVEIQPKTSQLFVVFIVQRRKLPHVVYGVNCVYVRSICSVSFHSVVITICIKHLAASEHLPQKTIRGGEWFRAAV